MLVWLTATEDEVAQMEKRISGTTRLLGLIGSPVEHSGSPAMYNYGFQKLGIDYAYLVFNIGEVHAKDFIETAKLLNMKGFNVTMPCKSEVATLMDELSPAAKIIGAVNTVVNNNGKLTGHNTDGVGFVRNLEDHGVTVKDKKIALLGGGGAGTSIFAQLALDGAREILVFNRKGANFDKLLGKKQLLQEMVPECQVEIYDLEQKKLLHEKVRECDILINATNVGMAPKEGESLIEDLSVYREDMVVAEIIYNPLETKMMKDAKAAGVKKIVGGKGMLLWQGEEAFRLFTGRDMPVEEVKEAFFQGC